jgi:hypothetical protein
MEPRQQLQKKNQIPQEEEYLLIKNEGEVSQEQQTLIEFISCFLRDWQHSLKIFHQWTVKFSVTKAVRRDNRRSGAWKVLNEYSLGRVTVV